MPKDDIYRQSCDLPMTRNRVQFAQPHVPYVRPRKAPEQATEAPVTMEAPAPVVMDPKRVRRNFHLRIALTGLAGLSYLFITHAK